MTVKSTTGSTHPLKHLDLAIQTLRDAQKRVRERGCHEEYDLANVEFDIGTAMLQIKLAEQAFKWREVDKVAPPKDGSLLIIEEGGGEYAVVRWSERDGLEAWHNAYGGPATFMRDEDIEGLRWRPLTP